MQGSLFEVMSTIRVTCSLMVSTWLEEEITRLGYSVTSKSNSHVELKGTLTHAAHLCTHLRTAYKVLYLLEEFPAAHPDVLYAKLHAIHWDTIIPPNGYVCVESHTENDFIKDTRFTNLKAKDAIVDKIKQNTGHRPDSGPARSQTVIYLHWAEKQVKVYIDASGESLTRQGYRKMPYKAPLQESLAAAILHASAWDRNTTFINPMCGSGTLAIQAALMAMAKYPGHLRKNFGFMHINGYENSEAHAIWPATSSIKTSLPFKIIATDREAAAIQAAKINAEQAGVLHLIDFLLMDFRDTPIPKANGAVVINPEYGERLGDVTGLVEVYAAIGDFFKNNCAGYMGYVFTGNMELAGKIGLRPSRKTVFYNGRIECRLLAFELYQGTRRKDALPL